MEFRDHPCIRIEHIDGVEERTAEAIVALIRQADLTFDPHPNVVLDGLPLLAPGVASKTFMRLAGAVDPRVRSVAARRVDQLWSANPELAERCWVNLLADDCVTVHYLARDRVLETLRDGSVPEGAVRAVVDEAIQRITPQSAQTARSLRAYVDDRPQD